MSPITEDWVTIRRMVEEGKKDQRKEDVKEFIHSLRVWSNGYLMKKYKEELNE